MSVHLGLSLGGGAQFTLQGRNLAVENTRRRLQVAFALGLVRGGAELVQLGLQVTDAVESGLLGFPAGVERGQLLVLVGLVSPDRGQAFHRRRILLVGEGQFLHGEPVHGPPQLVDLLRRGVDLHPEPGGGLIHQVDGLVRQLAAGDVAVGQRCGGHQCGVRDGDLVVCLVAFLQAAEDADGVLHAGLANVDLLEPALQGGVLLDVLAVLVQRGGADQPQLAAGQHGLEHVAGIHRGLPRGTGAHHRVDLVDERDDLAVRVLDLLQHSLEPLLELAAVLGAGHHGREVQRDQGLAAQAFRDVAGHDPLGQAFDDGGLAHAGFADDDGVVLGAAAQHLDDAPDLGVAADDRVQLPGPRHRRQVRAELLQRLEGVFRVRAGDLPVAADTRQGGEQRLMGGTGVAH